MSFNVTGLLKKKGETRKATDTFSVRTFALEIGGDTDYPQLVEFQLVQDRCELLNGLQKDQELTVHFDLRGREWNDKVITNLNAWKIDLEGAEPTKAKKSTPEVKTLPVPEGTATAGDDDLPF
jgi:single-strand DNA-binding protein